MEPRLILKPPEQGNLLLPMRCRGDHIPLGLWWIWMDYAESCWFYFVELYCHRWEIELGFREIKQTMLDSAYHLRSKRPDMVRQELWGVLLAYNLIRRIMTMAATVTGIWPNQLSFSSSSMAVIQYFSSVSIMSPGNIPIHWQHLLNTLLLFKLPARREDRRYPRWVKPKPSKYPHKKKDASQLNWLALSLVLAFLFFK